MGASTASKRLSAIREDLKGTTTQNGYFTYTEYNSSLLKWNITCTNCSRVMIAHSYAAESELICQCRRRRVGELSKLVGSVINWITVDELLVPESGLTKFRCHCICGTVEEYPAYYVRCKRIACCKNCTTKYKSLQYGGTGVPGETRDLRVYLRDTPQSTNWMRTIYQMYRAVCAASGTTSSDPSYLHLHHLESLSNIIKASNVSLSSDLVDMPTNLLISTFYDISNGLLLTKTLHKQLHHDLGSTPTKQQSLDWINNKRKENNLQPLIFSAKLSKYYSI